MINPNQNNGFFDFISELPLFFILFGGIIFTLVFGTFAYVIIKGLSSYFSNNAAEITRQRSKIVDKRSEVWGGSGDSSANTSHFITFEFEDHTRKELQVRSDQYGLITVGDQGELIYQGTRFKEFIRQY
ncbi:DUF2500 domain-containing protein [Paenibacillus wynnii]|uniref:DUF2500 domain-containing protein n=1 Tax=Paenibacillus wynnii TaxID=268407 RepID=UPI00278F433C|nr:DUF2500 domain-containing protein [Paenibacillus wynnii]MDQ0195581.1 hypothetical protein [Paenibacillus wynnii]